VSTIVQTNYSDCIRNWCNSMSTKQSLNSAWICLKMSGKPPKSWIYIKISNCSGLEAHMFPMCSHQRLPMFPYVRIFFWGSHHFQTSMARSRACDGPWHLAAVVELLLMRPVENHPIVSGLYHHRFKGRGRTQNVSYILRLCFWGPWKCKLTAPGRRSATNSYI
jgi:hypothetical protein